MSNNDYFQEEKCVPMRRGPVAKKPLAPAPLPSQLKPKFPTDQLISPIPPSPAPPPQQAPQVPFPPPITSQNLISPVPTTPVATPPERPLEEKSKTKDEPVTAPMIYGPAVAPPVARAPVANEPSADIKSESQDMKETTQENAAPARDDSKRKRKVKKAPKTPKKTVEEGVGIAVVMDDDDDPGPFGKKKDAAQPAPGQLVFLDDDEEENKERESKSKRGKKKEKGKKNAVKSTMKADRQNSARQKRQVPAAFTAFASSGGEQPAPSTPAAGTPAQAGNAQQKKAPAASVAPKKKQAPEASVHQKKQAPDGSVHQKKEQKTDRMADRSDRRLLKMMDKMKDRSWRGRMQQAAAAGATPAQGTPAKTNNKEPNEGFFKAMYSRAKTKIAAMAKNPNTPSASLQSQSDDTLIATDESINLKNEVAALYGTAADYPHGVLPSKGAKNHPDALFPDGRPWWLIRDEKPPEAKVLLMHAVTQHIKDHRFALVERQEDPKDLNPYSNDLNVMKERDEKYELDGVRMLGNTARNTLRAKGVLQASLKDKNARKLLDRPKVGKLRLIPPTQCIVYNRKQQKQRKCTRVAFKSAAGTDAHKALIKKNSKKTES